MHRLRRPALFHVAPRCSTSPRVAPCRPVSSRAPRRYPNHAGVVIRRNSPCLIKCSLLLRIFTEAEGFKSPGKQRKTLRRNNVFFTENPTQVF